MQSNASDIKAVGASGTTAGNAVKLDRKRFGELFEQHAPSLWCIAAAVVGNRSKAQDVVQEAAVIALGKLDEFDPATSFGAWMGQIVRFTALNEGRRGVRERSGQKRLASEQEHIGRSAPAANDAAMGETFDERTEAALNTLDETARVCLLLRTVLDRSYKDIAASLGIPEGTAMSHVFRARKAMRDQLEAGVLASQPKGRSA